jgi:hypothetical protein
VCLGYDALAIGAVLVLFLVLCAVCGVRCAVVPRALMVLFSGAGAGVVWCGIALFLSLSLSLSHATL